VIGAWAVLTALGFLLATVGVTGEGLFDRVTSGAPRAIGSESYQADQLITDGQTYSQRITLAVDGLDLNDEAAVNAAATALAPVRSDLARLKGLATNDAGVPMILDPINPAWCGDPTSATPVLCALAMPQLQGLRAADANGFVMTVDIAKGLTSDDEAATAAAVTERLHQAAQELPEALPGTSAAVGGESLILNELIGQMKEDLELGELIAFPIALIVMILVFAGFLAAAMPIVGALASIGTAMGLLFGFTYAFDVHTAVINVVTVVGLGLSIDYGLLMVSRFREELRRQGAMRSARVRLRAEGGRASRSTPAAKALAVTIKTAGRTIFFSALTIAVAVSGLMAFRPDLLRIFGFGGLMVVLLALLTATTLVPALLALFGEHLTNPSLLTRIPGMHQVYSRISDVSADEGVFSKLAAKVQRRPWHVMAGVIVVLACLAAPMFHLEIRNSTTELLTEGSEQRAFMELMEQQYPQYSPAAITVITASEAESSEALVQATEAWATSDLATVEQTRLIPLGTDGAYTVAQAGYAEIALEVLADDPEGQVARDAVRAIRDLTPDGLTVWVTGPAARLVDFQRELVTGGPLCLLVVVLAAFVLLFLMTGSLMIPLKALVTNVLSLSATLGVITWVFQDGNLAGLLNFSPMAGIESYIVVLLLVFGFGLAMDYEVFLISRIKESWDATGDADLSVRAGLQHSGRIITSAALIIVMVFIGFGAGQLIIIKELGLGLAIAVTIDATLVRMLLVPATMTILGRWNWWAPAPLRKVHLFAGLHH
jgi:RND superfamily putative drug exporter